MMTKNDLEYMKGKLKNGEFILFCGAGMSCDLENMSGKLLPKGDELQRLIWEIAFPGEAFESESTLQTLFHAAQKTNKRKLTELLKTTFDVKPSSIKEHHKGLIFGPWKRIYTLNIDNSIQRIHRYNERTSNSVSAFDRLNKEYSDKLNVIHLHGAFAGIPDEIIFSFAHYNEAAAMENVYHRKFAIDYSVSPIIFIGTGIEEPHLWASIQKRNTEVRGTMKPKSFLISPRISKSRAATLHDFGITHIQATTKEFYEYIRSHASDEYDEGVKCALVKTGSEMPEVSELCMPLKGATYYLEGAEPTFPDIISSHAIERHFTREANKKLGATPFVGVIGTAGSGKSTSLIQMALFVKANLPNKAYWIPVDIETSQIPYEKIESLPDGTYIFVDDINRLHPDAIDWLAKKCHEKNLKIRYACRTNHSDRIYSILSSYDAVEEIHSPDMTEEDIDDLINLLERTNKLGKLKNSTHDEMRNIFKDKCGRILLVAMIEATSGRKFEEKIEEEFESIQDPSRQEIYALCCMLIAVTWKSKKQHLIGAASGDAITKFHALERLLNTRMLIADGENVFPRHKVIAELVFKQLVKRGNALTLIKSAIAFLASTSTQSYQSPEMRIISKFYNHDFLKELFSLSQNREFLSDIEPVQSWDSHYWLHRGALEVEFGSLDSAEEYLNRSKSLSDPSHNNFVLRTELSYYYMRRANAEPEISAAKWNFEQAKRELEILIRDNGKRDPRCYNIYCRGIISFTKKWVADNDEQTYAYEAARAICYQGLKNHRGNEKLKATMHDLKREILSTTITTKPIKRSR